MRLTLDEVGEGVVGREDGEETKHVYSFLVHHIMKDSGNRQ